MDRIAAIKKSLTIFVCGIVGVVPVLGLLPALYALGCWTAVRSHYKGGWNPASAYLHGGAALALFGVCASGLLVVAIIIMIANG